MRFAVIGRAQAGKSTFAEYLGAYLGLKVSNTSDWLVEVETFRRKRLSELVENQSPAFQKQNDRAWLIALGDAVRSIQPDFLIEQSLRRGSIITGIRRREEFDLLPKDVVTIFIDRPEAISDNFDVPTDHVNYSIMNCGSLEDLKAKALEIANDCLGHMADAIQRRG